MAALAPHLWPEQQQQQQQQQQQCGSSAAAGALWLEWGEDGSGSVYNEQNLRRFVATVRAHCSDGHGGGADRGSDGGGGGGGCLSRGGRPLDLLVADGGFEAARSSRRQESQMARLVLCQCVPALCLLRRGGSFVVKLFGAATACMASLLQLLAAHFATLALVKPVTSRPASGERYLVCRGFAGDGDGEGDGDGDGNAALPALVAHLLAANRACAEAEEAAEAAEAAAVEEQAAAGAAGGAAGTTSLFSLVALGALAADAELCEFLRASNDALARAQLRACEAIAEEAEAAGGKGTRGREAAQEGGDAAAGTRRAGVHCPSYWRLWGLDARYA